MDADIAHTGIDPIETGKYELGVVQLSVGCVKAERHFGGHEEQSYRSVEPCQ
jgi:hypothetical protein